MVATSYPSENTLNNSVREHDAGPLDRDVDVESLPPQYESRWAPPSSPLSPSRGADVPAADITPLSPARREGKQPLIVMSYRDGEASTSVI